MFFISLVHKFSLPLSSISNSILHFFFPDLISVKNGAHILVLSLYLYERCGLENIVQYKIPALQVTSKHHPYRKWICTLVMNCDSSSNVWECVCISVIVCLASYWNRNMHIIFIMTIHFFYINKKKVERNNVS